MRHDITWIDSIILKQLMAHNPFISLLAVFIATVSWPQSVLCGFQEMGSSIIDGSDQVPLFKENGNISFSETWQVLGPFRTGTRG